MYPSALKNPDIPKRITGLVDLADNFWWSWNNEARLLFKMLSRSAWKDSIHNPVKMLFDMDKKSIEKAQKDQNFLSQYDSVMNHFKQYIKNEDSWFSNTVANAKPSMIAFFSAEYGFHHSLPFYAGGLGFLAGDILKESSDLGIPIVGVGFMYPKGYLKQRIALDGWQMDQDEILDRENIPISRMLDKNGEHLIVKVPVIDPPIFVEIWKVQIGRVSLYLLDADIDANTPWNRSITSHLYGVGPEQRLRQEIILGIGGTEVLNILGLQCPIIHLNEGFTAFAIFERIRKLVEKGLSFHDAFEQVKATTIFTTHTPIPAGNDVFSFQLMEKYFNTYWSSLGINRETFFQLGNNPADSTAGFNMAAFALKSSQYHNGVSKRHGEVARQMWTSLWPDLPENEVPINYITNGVHVPTWIEPKLEELFNTYLDPGWLAEHDNPSIWDKINTIPDKELWKVHDWLKTKLILKIMDRARQRWMEQTSAPQILLASGLLLDPTILTIGFARRFVEYKRATMIFQDIERLKKIVNDRWRPVQIIFAGKAHPADDQGKRIIQQVFNICKDPSFGGRIAFIEDYNEQLAQYLVHGVDVWLNTPLPPYEACGTSGMKASLNGVPNCSILDGWWHEGFNGKNGWAFGKTQTNNSTISDSEALYQILENKIIPLYYTVDTDGISSGWVNVMKEAIKSTAPRFSAQRMMKEYAQKCYQPALSSMVNTPIFSNKR